MYKQDNFWFYFSNNPLGIIKTINIFVFGNLKVYILATHAKGSLTIYPNINVSIISCHLLYLMCLIKFCFPSFILIICTQNLYTNARNTVQTKKMLNIWSIDWLTCNICVPWCCSNKSKATPAGVRLEAVIRLTKKKLNEINIDQQTQN